MLYSTLVFMLLLSLQLYQLRPEPFEGLYPVLLPQSFIAPPKGPPGLPASNPRRTAQTEATVLYLWPGLSVPP
ncbi:uncharacterized protein B0J16DRAFT_11214 [Fusarium flagelliforme]|uniref:uncharacterized protein n=1 Tax=Fusarium flagelliforme TaxID=2675880 RepID=UPI001E8E7527|nr:uncharacterized protein B0J16DRAFT_11214 [Fusarium flagelliforme]KAH7197023.1 hypothetical protein B0J16DRAFT_11214 [Fusarium flagelliforme]